MAKMGRPKKEIDGEKLKALMRLKPTLLDTAAFFEVNASTIEREIRDKFNLTFAEFRDQNMVHTRFSLIRTAIKQAENGNTAMLIFCLKNLCGWQDRFDNPKDDDTKKEKEMSEDKAKEKLALLKQMIKDE